MPPGTSLLIGFQGLLGSCAGPGTTLWELLFQGLPNLVSRVRSLECEYLPWAPSC